MNNQKDRIVVHCSDSSFGTSRVIQEWQQSGKWEKVDYDYVVLNGYTEARQIKQKQPWSFLNGSVECGCSNELNSPDRKTNQGDIGICLIGLPGEFSLQQYYAVRTVINVLCWHYDIALKNVVSHTEIDSQAACPGIDMKYFRQFLKDDRYIEQLVRI